MRLGARARGELVNAEGGARASAAACLSARTDSAFQSQGAYDHGDRRASNAPDALSCQDCGKVWLMFCRDEEVVSVGCALADL
jgi:hypothetical protein